MAETGNLIDFNIIETQKENIAALPSGRSAKSLAQIYSPVLGITSPLQIQDANSSVRQQYENEIIQIDDSDDPLDVYDRYIRWTLDAYPSASATPQSQLLPLLERATKTFLKFDNYKNDPRYLKIWLQYIRLFSDAPRETFCFLAKNHIGSALALYYEEYAAWLENGGRWNQAEEIYRIGIEKEARPLGRLARKFGEFEKRANEKPANQQGSNSPALPTVRPVLAAKVDPFSTASPPSRDPQAASRAAASACSNSRRPKLQIFSDDSQPVPSSIGDSAKDWDNIGTLAERRKENVRAPQPWTGEGLGTGIAPNIGIPKMTIFRDKASSNQSTQQFASSHPALDQRAVNQRTGRIECVFVNLEAIYPNPHDPNEEYCFEELRAAKRGWLNHNGVANPTKTRHKHSKRTERGLGDTTTTLIPLAEANEPISSQQDGKKRQSIILNDENNFGSHDAVSDVDIVRRLRREERTNRTRKIKVREVKGETQTIQTNLDSPRGSKMKRKISAEPTMTVQTRAAMDEIYEIFNEPLDPTKEADVEHDNGDDSEIETDDEDDYTSNGESTGTGRLSASTSEYGDDTQGEVTEVGDTTTATATNTATSEVTGDNSAWSEFTARKHMQLQEGESSVISNVGQTESFVQLTEPVIERQAIPDEQSGVEVETVTPTFPEPETSRAGTFFIPIPPESYDAPTRPYRDPVQAAANRLPFMTPIVEKTESSLGTGTGHKDKGYSASKTPCPKSLRGATVLEIDDEVWSSPLQEALRDVQLEESRDSGARGTEGMSNIDGTETSLNQMDLQECFKKECVVTDTICNPMDPSVRQLIMRESKPPLRSIHGYFEHFDSSSNLRGEIKRFCKSLNGTKLPKGNAEKTLIPQETAPVLRFNGSEKSYTIKRELGAGAYGPVYLVEQTKTDLCSCEDTIKGELGSCRRSLEAVKMEDPPSPWEFFIIRTTHRRLGGSRASESIVQAHEMHVFKDDGYLIEEYQDQGTLLDLVNAINDQNHAAGGTSGIDEMLAMFFTIELLRTMEELHSRGIMHGDLKADNVLLRFCGTQASSSTDGEMLSTQYKRDGKEGWSSQGITLIDFGRGIDMHAFVPEVQFVADWQTSATDCAEMRELCPWTFQADYYGIAAIAHTMLFGKYIDTVVEKGVSVDVFGGSAKRYKLKEGLKRYWQTELWNEFFTLMLNPLRFVEQEENQRLPCTIAVKSVREKMETWLENNADKGLGLRAMIRRAAATRKKS